MAELDPRTVRQRARIMQALESGPMSAQQIADKIHATRAAVLIHIKKMRKEKILRIAGHIQQYRCRELPLYGIGSEPDEKYVRAKYRPGANSFEVQREKVRQAILEQLKKERATGPELALLTGFSEPTIRKYMPRMKEEGLVHRCAWMPRKEGGVPMSVWAVGNKADAPKSRIVTRSAPLDDMYEHRIILRKKKAAQEIIKIARQAPKGIFAALGI